MASRFTLRVGRWYACEIIGDEFDEDLCSYSPIRVRRVDPLHTGRRRLRLGFYHANYPEGVRDKVYELAVLERARHARGPLAYRVHHPRRRADWRRRSGMPPKNHNAGPASRAETNAPLSSASSATPDPGNRPLTPVIDRLHQDELPCLRTCLLLRNPYSTRPYRAPRRMLRDPTDSSLLLYAISDCDTIFVDLSCRRRSAAVRQDPPVPKEPDVIAEPWVSVEDVAKHLGVAKDSIYRWIEAKGLPAKRIGRLWKFKLSEVDAWVNAGGAAERPTEDDNTAGGRG